MCCWYLDEYLSVSKPWVDVDTMISFDSFDIRILNSIKCGCFYSGFIDPL